MVVAIAAIAAVANTAMDLCLRMGRRMFAMIGQATNLSRFSAGEAKLALLSTHTHTHTLSLSLSPYGTRPSTP